MQLVAQRRLLAMYRLNPLGTNLLIGQVVFLLALEYHAGDLAMGLLYGGVYLAGIAAFAAPAVCARFDPARVAAGTWLLRTLCCFPYLLLPLVPGDDAKVVLLVAVFLQFMVWRTVGVAALNVATAAYSAPGELSGLIARSHFWWHVGTLAMSVVSTAVLARWPASEPAYIALLAVGIGCSLITAWTMRNLPPVGVALREPLARAIPEVLRLRPVRDVVAATLLVVPQAVAAAYQLNMLKGPLGLSAGGIIALSLAGIALSIAATRLLGLLLPRTGLRPVQLVTHLALALLGLAWAFSDAWPASWRLPLGMVLFVLSQALLAASTAILAALHVDRLPSRAPVATSALYQAVGALAGLFGIAAVWALGQVPLGDVPGMGPYAHAFLVWSACSAGVCLIGLATGGTAQVLADLRLMSPANLVGLAWNGRKP
jgi:hypothetical protein